MAVAIRGLSGALQLLLLILVTAKIMRVLMLTVIHSADRAARSNWIGVERVTLAVITCAASSFVLTPHL